MENANAEGMIPVFAYLLIAHPQDAYQQTATNVQKENLADVLKKDVSVYQIAIQIHVHRQIVQIVQKGRAAYVKKTKRANANPYQLPILATELIAVT